MMLAKNLERIVSGKFLSSSEFDKAVEELISLCNYSNEESASTLSEVLQREMSFSTYFADEMSVPRSEIKSNDLCLLVGISKSGIKNESNEIKVIFLLLYGEKRKSEYLSLLSYIYRILSGRQFKNRLISCETNDEIKTQVIKGLFEIEG